MPLLNYSHPLIADQLELLKGVDAGTVIDIPCRMDHNRRFAEQARELADAVGLTPQEWQTLPLVLNLPALSPAAAALLAEIHGRCGYFPPVLRLRPVEGAIPPRFEVAEILNLQAARDAARERR